MQELQERLRNLDSANQAKDTDIVRASSRLVACMSWHKNVSKFVLMYTGHNYANGLRGIRDARPGLCVFKCVLGIGTFLIIMYVIKVAEILTWTEHFVLLHTSTQNRQARGLMLSACHLKMILVVTATAHAMQKRLESQVEAAGDGKRQLLKSNADLSAQVIVSSLSSFLRIFETE